VSPTGVAATTAEDVTWIVRKGAILIQRWEDGFKLFNSKTMKGVKDGDRLHIVRGQVQP
jgi:hypothetical protein